MSTIADLSIRLGIDDGDLVKGMSGLGGKLDRGISKVTTPVTKTAKRVGKLAGKALVGGVAVGLAGLATLATLSIKGGLTRALNIEDAQKKLEGLGHDAKSIETIMTSALSSVKGTAFGLDSAATSAAAAVAAGVKPGEDLTRVLGLTADAATIMGRSFGDSGSIINKVLASNRLSMEEVNQLHDAGLPILSMLGDEYGVTAEKMREMISEGKVGSEEFLDAIENNIAGAALKSGETTRGAFANMGAAMSRFGEVVVKPFLPLMRNVLGGITTVWDKLSDAMKPVMKQFQQSARFKDFAENTKRIPKIFDNMVERAGPLVDKARELKDRFGDWLDSLGGLSGLLAGVKNQAGNFTEGLTLLGGPLAVIARELFPLIKPLLKAILPPLADLANSLAPALADVLNFLNKNVLPGFIKILTAVIGWLGENKGFVFALGAAVIAFKILTTVMAVNPFILIATAVTAIAALIITNWDTIKGFLTRTWEQIKRGASRIWESIKGFFSGALDFIKNLFLNFTPLGLFIKHMDTIKEVAAGAANWVRDRFNALVDFFKRMPGRIANAVSGLFDGLKSAFRNAVNWLIDKWNNFSLGIDLPFGGGRIALDTPNIPRFHDGGVFRAPPGQREGLAVLEDGERVSKDGPQMEFNLYGTPQDLVRQVSGEVAWNLGS